MNEKNNEVEAKLLGLIKQINEDWNYKDLGIAFQHWAAVTILSLDDETVYEEINLNRPGDRGIDYFNIDATTRTVSILQTKFTEKFKGGADRNDLDSFSKTLDRLINSPEGSIAFQGYQEKYRVAMKENFETKFIFIFTGKFTSENLIEIKLLKKHETNEIIFQYIDINGISALMGDSRTPPCSLGIIHNELFVSELDNIKKIVTTIPASELKRIQTEIDSLALFSLNPRYYLGKTKPSKGINETLKNFPDRLWHYNNGISAVCDEFTYNEQNNRLEIKNLKIVNGCQTVTTIGKYQGHLNEKATVLLRLSKIDDEAFKQKISKNTNTQNRIRSSDLFSDKEELKTLEDKFRKYEFFWERKRGTFREQPNKEKIQYSKNGMKNLRVINNIIAARLALAYKLLMPHYSIQLSEDVIFSEDEIPISKDKQIQPFYSIYKDAEPFDFIIPHIFYYLLKEINHEQGQNHPDQLLNINIGKYYIVGIIGKIFTEIEKDVKNQIEEKIYNIANNNTMNELKNRLKLLIAGLGPSIVFALDQENHTKLSKYSAVELRDKLKKPKLDEIYTQYKAHLSINQKTSDPFVDYLITLIPK